MSSEHSFDRAMRTATESEWKAAKERPYQSSESLRRAIKGVIDSQRVDSSAHRGRGLRPLSLMRILEFLRSPLGYAVAGALAILICGALFGVKLLHPTETFAMSVPALRGGPPEAGRLVEPSVTVAINWKKGTISMPLKAGGQLVGSFRPSQLANSSAMPLTFDVVVGTDEQATPVTGTGQWVVMPRDADAAPQRLSATAVLWAKLTLQLRSNGKEELLYRVFGTP